MFLKINLSNKLKGIALDIDNYNMTKKEIRKCKNELRKYKNINDNILIEVVENCLNGYF